MKGTGLADVSQHFLYVATGLVAVVKAQDTATPIIVS
jgi:hypothetical protein